jgi:hypothetical protein
MPRKARHSEMEKFYCVDFQKLAADIRICLEPAPLMELSFHQRCSLAFRDLAIQAAPFAPSVTPAIGFIANLFFEVMQ